MSGRKWKKHKEKRYRPKGKRINHGTPYKKQNNLPAATELPELSDGLGDEDLSNEESETD